jgi:hypothetical protein
VGLGPFSPTFCAIEEETLVIINKQIAILITLLFVLTPLLLWINMGLKLYIPSFIGPSGAS